MLLLIIYDIQSSSAQYVQQQVAPRLRLNTNMVQYSSATVSAKVFLVAVLTVRKQRCLVRTTNIIIN